jgi:fructose-bisphosphate aldolase class II
MASTGSIRQHLSENPANFDPRKFYKMATAGMKEICKARFQAFGCEGMASKIKADSLELMFERYASGQLDPKIS